MPVVRFKTWMSDDDRARKAASEARRAKEDEAKAIVNANLKAQGVQRISDSDFKKLVKEQLKVTRTSDARGKDPATTKNVGIGSDDQPRVPAGSPDGGQFAPK